MIKGKSSIEGALREIKEEATTDEVAACKWMTVSEIRKLYEENKLVRTLDYFFCVMQARR